MTKKQYLKKLEYCISALPADERNEALDYYSNYFDDADDDDKVMMELGEPEDLAKTIIEKFTCVPAVSKNKKKSQKNESEEETEDESDDLYEYEDEKLCYEFKKNQVKHLAVSLAACDCVFKSGKDFKVEARGISRDDLRCEINKAGTLIVENKKKIPGKKLFNHERTNNWCPRVLITLADDAEFENVRINLGAGQIRTKKLNITSLKTMIDVGAGNFELNGLTSGATSLRCSVGHLKVEGRLFGYTKVDCGMGACELKIAGDEDDYSYDAKVGLGNIKFGKDKYSGFSKSYFGDPKENHVSIVCGMGEVKVKFE